jgi:hypothetical protein
MTLIKIDLKTILLISWTGKKKERHISCLKRDEIFEMTMPKDFMVIISLIGVFDKKI